MKTVILCGGRGTRLGKGTDVPKALIEIGGKPIIWHLLKIYSHFGFNEFILCLGYLGENIKRYFIEHQWINSDFTMQTGVDKSLIWQSELENWNITFAETGLDTNTGGRLKRIMKYLDETEEDFFVSYGDGLSNVDLNKLLAFHKSHQRVATMTAVHARSPFGVFHINDENLVLDFQEKPMLPDLINGGFFVFNKRIFDYLHENSVLETETVEKLIADRQIVAYHHRDFWKCMDTYKDNLEFNQLWANNNADWKIW